MIPACLAWPEMLIIAFSLICCHCFWFIEIPNLLLLVLILLYLVHRLANGTVDVMVLMYLRVLAKDEYDYIIQFSRTAQSR